MKKLTEYNWSALTILNDYSNDFDLAKLESSLFKLEEKIRKSKFPHLDENCGLWFRFFDDDNECTTIINIISSLKGSKENKEYINENIKGVLTLDVTKEIQIYFS